jgi:hypothetical protein
MEKRERERERERERDQEQGYNKSVERACFSIIEATQKNYTFGRKLLLSKCPVCRVSGSGVPH